MTTQGNLPEKRLRLEKEHAMKPENQPASRWEIIFEWKRILLCVIILAVVILLAWQPGWLLE